MLHEQVLPGEMDQLQEIAEDVPVQGDKRSELGRRDQEPHDEEDDTQEQELRQRAGERYQSAPPTAVQGVTADGEAAETVQDDVAVGAEQSAHEDVPHLVNE